jgi:hypothetical protein
MELFLLALSIFKLSETQRRFVYGYTVYSTTEKLRNPKNTFILGGPMQYKRTTSFNFSFAQKR